MERKKRTAISEECIRYAAKHGSVAAARVYENHPASINRMLRVRGLGRGLERGPQMEGRRRSDLDHLLESCGYTAERKREQVKADLERHA